MTVAEAIDAMLAEHDNPLTHAQKGMVRTLLIATVGSLERIADALETIAKRGASQ